MERRHGSLCAWISENGSRTLRAGAIAAVVTAGLLLLPDSSPIASLRLVGSALAAYAPPALFSQPEVVAVEASPRYIAVGDVNQDGHPDLIVVNSSGLQILLGQAGGSFVVAGTYAAGLSPTSVAVGDLNGDGHPDLIVANGDNHERSSRPWRRNLPSSGSLCAGRDPKIFGAWRF